MKWDLVLLLKLLFDRGSADGYSRYSLKTYFLQKFPYIFQPSKISILVTNLCAGDAKGSGHQVR